VIEEFSHKERQRQIIHTYVYIFINVFMAAVFNPKFATYKFRKMSSILANFAWKKTALQSANYKNFIRGRNSSISSRMELD